MTKEREALKLTLGALKDHVGNYKLDASGCTQQAAAIAAGEEALAQPEQEPLAWVTQVGTLVQVGMTNLKTGLMYGWTPLYTTPPKRQPLTDGEIQAVIDKTPHYDEYGRLDLCGDVNWFDLARAIEAKLKEKNQ